MPAAREYFGLDFPEYSYVPYPKWVTRPDTGKRQIVQSEDEEKAVMALQPPAPVVAAPVAVVIETAQAAMTAAAPAAAQPAPTAAATPATTAQTPAKKS